MVSCDTKSGSIIEAYGVRSVRGCSPYRTLSRATTVPTTLHLMEHFSPEELYRRYRSSKDVVERAHWQIIWLKSQGRTTSEIRRATGYSAYWIRTLIRRYNDGGAEALRDRRREHPGAAPMLSAAEQATLERLLERGRAPDGGPWTGPKVARWIEQATGRSHVHNQRGWDYLVRLGFSAQTPRPRHAGASVEEQAAFKK